MRRFLCAFEDVDEAYAALIKYINWREEYGVNCLSRGDDDIEEQIALDKAEVLDFPDHKGRSVCDPFHGHFYPGSNHSLWLRLMVCLFIFRPIVLVTVRNHDARSRDLNVITKFIIYILVSMGQYVV